MQNTQPIEPRSLSADGTLDVHSMFHTIQGEGPFAGRAAFFVRLFGCNLMCPGCDTDYTGQRVALAVDALVELIVKQVDPLDADPEIIVITGGEPMRQNIVPLVYSLLRLDLTVQVESNGTLFLAALPYDDPRFCLVVSPKTAKIHPEAARLADVYKYVMRDSEIDPEDGLPTRALGHTLGPLSHHVARPPEGWQGAIYLQPMDEDDEAANLRNARACAASVMKHRRYILGSQMHKPLELP